MAATVYDDDDPTRPAKTHPRRYFGGFQILADAIGRTYFTRPETPEQIAVNKRTHSALNGAIRTLIEAGMIRRISPAINGHHAEYEVLPNISTISAEIEQRAANF